MVATINVQEGNGVTPDWTTVTAARFCMSDVYNPLTTTPCVIPASSVAYSWWKHFLLDISGSFTKVDNIRIYCSGSIAWSWGDTGQIYVGLKDDGDTTDNGHGCPTGEYDRSTGDATSGDYMDHATLGHTWYKDETVTPGDFNDYDSGSALLIDSVAHESAEKSKAVVLQLMVDESNAIQGDQSDEDVTWLYDEI